MSSCNNIVRNDPKRRFRLQQGSFAYKRSLNLFGNSCTKRHWFRLKKDTPGRIPLSKKKKNFLLPPGVEPGSRDSKSHVLTATLREIAVGP